MYAICEWRHKKVNNIKIQPDKRSGWLCICFWVWMKHLWKNSIPPSTAFLQPFLHWLIFSCFWKNLNTQLSLLCVKSQFTSQTPFYFLHPRKSIYTHHLQFLKSSRMVLLPLQISEIFEVVKLISSIIVTVIFWKSTEKKIV